MAPVESLSRPTLKILFAASEFLIRWGWLAALTSATTAPPISEPIGIIPQPKNR